MLERMNSGLSNTYYLSAGYLLCSCLKLWVIRKWEIEEGSVIGPKGKDFILEKEAELQGGGRGAKIVLIMGVAFSFVSSVAIIGKL